MTMVATEKEADEAESVEVEVTGCPECGTEWEVVITERRGARKDRDLRQL